MILYQHITPIKTQILNIEKSYSKSYQHQNSGVKVSQQSNP